MNFVKMVSKFAVLALVLINSVNGFIDFDIETRRPAFDPEIIQNALDPELCREQLEHIRQNSILRFIFLEAGMRVPKGILQFNTLDLGNYDQCLDIEHNIQTSVIEGKFCMIRGPISRAFAKVVDWPEFDLNLLNNSSLMTFKRIDELQTKVDSIGTGVDQSRTIAGLPWNPILRMGLCIPKTCTSQEGISGLLFNLTLLGIQFQEDFCRFKDDKPWVVADYVAISILSLIGLLTILSTTYDLCHTFILKKGTLCKSFSVYTNGKRLTTFNNNPNNLNCVDGIRAISMFWIIAGHTYTLLPPQINVIYVFQWINDLESIWVTAAPYAVDTFFLLSGILLVYTTVGKLSGMKLLKNLHLFYLHRILRIFPVLAAIVLLQASLLHRIADGPNWHSISWNTDRCRTFWWATLLYVQNYVNVDSMCIPHSWYLAIDMHCYIVSPILLFWILNGKKKQVWISLAAGLLISLAVATAYSFYMQFPGWIIGTVREGGSWEYHRLYYFNTITRAPPFFVGMVFGYILNVNKGKKLHIPHFVAVSFWVFSAGAMLGLMYVTHLMKDASTWDYWIVDDLMNSFSRSIWALAVGWIIVACQYGYGGPMNWFLCLDVWKLPSRISLALYLFHYQIQYVLQGVARTSIFFRPFTPLYMFLSQVTLSFGVAFAVTLLIDSPFSVLVKLILGDGIKKPRKEITDKE